MGMTKRIPTYQSMTVPEQLIENPPYIAREVEVGPVRAGSRRGVASAAERMSASRFRKKLIHRTRIPRGWGKLPEKGGYREEVEWVYRNYSRVVDVKWQRLRLKEAVDAAPSEGAIGLAEWALTNRNAFYDKLAPKVLGGIDDPDGGEKKRERLRVEEIEEILKQFVEVK